jgi:hypothetical protein
MKIKKLGLISIAGAFLLTPALAQAGNFETAVKEAKIEIDKAKAANYEWRDSRKMLKTAEQLNKEGKTDKAMKLVEQAKMQGQVAVSQAELQSSVNGPR